MAAGSERYMPGPHLTDLTVMWSPQLQLYDGEEIAVMADAEERSVADSTDGPRQVNY
jgi:hypothetical protein